LVKPIVDRCKGPIQQALSDAKMDPSKITKIILVGGPTRMPIIQKFVEDAVGRKVERGIDPMECVAMGAAVQAAVLTGEVSFIFEKEMDKDGSNIGFDKWRWNIIGICHNGASSGRANPWKLVDERRIAGERPTIFLYYFFGQALEVDRSAVVTEALPCFENIRQGSSS
jgi:hypothetical protein